MSKGHIKLHIFQAGSVTVRRYLKQALESQVKLFRDAVDPDVLLMEDNDWPHRTYRVSEYFQM